MPDEYPCDANGGNSLVVRDWIFSGNLLEIRYEDFFVHIGGSAVARINFSN